jgi:Protein of unknown function (DUF3592)
MSNFATAGTLIARWLGPWTLVVLWPIAFTVMWAIGNMARDSKDEKLLERSLTWPETQGVVISSRIVWGHLEVKYEYSLPSGNYVGKYKLNLSPAPPGGFSQAAARTAREAKQLIQEYPNGTDVIVRYAPQRPGDSVLYCKVIPTRASDQAWETPPRFSRS